MKVIDKPLKVGKTDRFYLGGPDLIAWLSGEALKSFTVEPDTDLASLSGVPSLDEPGKIGFFLTGVAPGRCEIHVNYETATRSDCETITVVVKNC